MAIIELRYKDPYELGIFTPKKFFIDDKTRIVETEDRDRTLFETFIAFHLLNTFKSVNIARSAFCPEYYTITVYCNEDYDKLYYWLKDNTESIE